MGVIDRVVAFIFWVIPQANCRGGAPIAKSAISRQATARKKFRLCNAAPKILLLPCPPVIPEIGRSGRWDAGDHPFVWKRELPSRNDGVAGLENLVSTIQTAAAAFGSNE
jgi:hypothetical protein